ncbi:gamma-mobile-trio protein GmtX [Hahella ganghwensis]|uniref:gamma-mobile-trio protein GmtX n=1 Tax=Hahella ganghwensis TaxID=286420 RepID=UPI0003615DCB|nr:gamma-mobile-trio protein GmtX [Hahella ganghwensis]
MSPSELLEKLKLGASARQSKTLDAVYAVCQEQVDRDAYDFSYSTIARIGADRGVPKAQSIRNRSGEAYQALIKHFAEMVKPNQPRKRKSADAWIDEITDPKTRLLVSKQQAELDEAKRLVREIVPPGTTIVVDDRRGGLSRHRLSDVERRALEFLASDEFLKEWGYVLGDRGEVVDSQGNRLFKPGTIDAIKKALEYL